MKQKVVVALITMLACAVLASAQTTEQEPKPGPELQKLGYFIGTWDSEGQMKASMFGPAGKVSNVTRREWILGNFFYLTHHEEKNPAGKHEVLSITGYDPEKKVYVTYSFSLGGTVSHSEGTLVNNTWTWNASFDMNGKTINTRTVIMPTSATSYDFKWEVAPNGNDWTTVQEGTAKKVR